MLRILFAIAIAIAIATAAAAAPGERWVDEEVGYIITEPERELYRSLATDEERERFVEAFWARRDPNRATVENEARVEHYRRLGYANEVLGRESFVPGWRTDRGRFYVLLGEPRTVSRFYGHNDLKEAELWFYQGARERGLPSFFYLLFFKPDEVGDFRLYHPVADGPASLLRRADADPIETLEAIDPELAHASLSFDAGEPPDLVGGRPSLGVDALLARIEEAPKRAIRTDYVDAWMQYRDRVVASDYSFNWVPNTNLFAVMASDDGTPIVHYSVELAPADFGLLRDEGSSRFYTTLDVDVEVTDPRGVVVHATSRPTRIELSSEQVDAVRTAPVAYQDDFPIVPGRYRISVYLQNRALKNWTVAETVLDLPAPAPMTITDVILCRKASDVAGTFGAGEVRTFQLGATKLEPATGNVFASGDEVIAFAQVFAPRHDATVRFELVDADGGDRVHDLDTGARLGELGTLGLEGGAYEVRARLVAGDGTVVDDKRVRLTLSPRAGIPSPGFVYRRGFNTRVPGLLALVRGDQRWRLSRFDEAQQDFETAVAAGNPDLPQARWKLATALLRRGDGERALALLAPLASEHPRQFEVVAGLGSSYYLRGEYAAAVPYLERALTLRPPDTSLLNALGDAHQRLGNADDAKRYFERSLALDPDQEDVERRLRRGEPY